jgi:adenylate kinase
MTTPNTHYTTLAIKEIKRNGRAYVLQCEHTLLQLSSTYIVELPGHVLKQLAGLLIQEEGVNEQKATNSPIVTGVVQ